MKDFNLEKANAGYPLVYRNGHKPKEFHYFKECNDFPVCTVNNDGFLVKSLKNGRYYIDEAEYDYDLFLDTQKVMKYFLIYSTDLGLFCKLYDTPEIREQKKQIIESNGFPILDTFEREIEI